jgi:hypothetical protein
MHFTVMAMAKHIMPKQKLIVKAFYLGTRLSVLILYNALQSPPIDFYSSQVWR